MLRIKYNYTSYTYIIFYQNSQDFIKFLHENKLNIKKFSIFKKHKNLTLDRHQG